MPRTHTARFGAPRLIVRTLLATSGATLLVLAVLLGGLTIEARGRSAWVAMDRLDGTRQMFAALETGRHRDTSIEAAVLARSQALVAALGGVETEYGLVVDAGSRQAAEGELARLTDLLDLDAAALVDLRGVIVASAGAQRGSWLPGQPARTDQAPLGGNGGERILRRSYGVFRVVALPLMRGPTAVGEVHLATVLDDAYATKLAALSRTDMVLMLNHEVLGATVPPQLRDELRRFVGELPESGVVMLGGERYALRCGLFLGPVRFYAILPVDSATAGLGGAAPLTVLLILLGALALGGVASLWLARSISGPIDRLAQQLRQMARARDFGRRLPSTGSARELDGLTDTFNQMMASISAAEAQTELAYVGAIKALATALDCRDPYTAGHSERVSTLAVMTGRQLRLDPDDLDVLRLGALLHDIGKIGIRDNVLTKAGPLTPEEFDIIKMHPTLGAHILRQVPFLNRHLPIVELHHERPDGRGYPHGLLGQATPLLVRIVHVADAFDAMTSARAYRGAQEPAHAIAELWRFAGSQFDTDVVEAFVAAWSAVVPQEALAGRPGALLPFPGTPAAAAS